MARRPRAPKRRRGDSDDDEPQATSEAQETGQELPDAPSAGSDGAASDRDEPENHDDTGATPGDPDPARKRQLNGTPTTAQDEAELARRRRRRQSLVFQKRRQSLTPSKNLAGGDAEGRPNRQYISDMYSTIIKMSSENKINIKNTWSLHLIDHMEDILAAPQEERTGIVEDANTFNFQKASCTLDASVKIYSYRVDDTWTSSYKILENLSRSGGEKRVDRDVGDEDDDDIAEVEDGEDGAHRRPKKKGPRKVGGAAKTIEKNLNNITLKSYELDFEPDPLFHKMSQTFDEGGAKGMLLANLGVYDGAKILLNSADVKLSTRTLIETKKERIDTEEDVDTADDTESKPPRKPSRIDLSKLGSLSCFSKDITSMAICPPLNRLYEQIEELQDPDTTQKKVIISEPVLPFPKKNECSADESAVEATDESLSTTEPNELQHEDSVMEDVSEGVLIDKNNETVKDSNDDADDHDDENNEPDDQGFEFGGCEDMDVEMQDDDGDVPMTDVSTSIEGNPTQEETVSDEVDENEPVTERHIDPVTNLSSDPKPLVIKSAADYFRSQLDDETVKDEEDVAYSQLIETALMRSVILEAEGTAESNDRGDYSYFDTKLLKNWAGPSHLKFSGARKISSKMLALIDDLDETQAPTKRGRKPQQKKSVSLAAEKRSLVVDFLSSDVPDFAKLLKVPKATGVTLLSKQVVKRQLQKSAELVFPVDAHIETNIFFRHFLKPRLQLFHRRLQPSRGVENDVTQIPSASDPGLAEADNLAYDDGGQDFGVDGYSDDDDSENEFEREGTTQFFSSANLITAERIVEKVDVHYERVPKRVDVKKLKTSIWSHLESETALLGKRKSRVSDRVEPEPERAEESDEELGTIVPTTFDSVVHGVAGQVPSNVTVSFYFICMLHLANEKGLRLTGQEDLSNFVIKKEERLEH